MSARNCFEEIDDDATNARAALDDAQRRREAALGKAADEADRVARLVGMLVERTGIAPQMAADSVVDSLRLEGLVGPEKFETEDFRIPSEGWEAVAGANADGHPIMENPEGDVWEITLE
ncbi:MAG: hypothetical protein Q7U75_02225 [Desulfobacterales bacterium]|nr:hypothetical protein [Desulfobacterales bacterium]